MNDRKMTTVHNGWVIEFEKNVHMYCHRLKASKAGMECHLSCETFVNGSVGVFWPSFQLDEATSRDLAEALREWAKVSGFDLDLDLTHQNQAG